MNRVTLCIVMLFILALALSLPSWLSNEEVQVDSQSEEAWVPNYQASKMRSTLYDKLGQINHQVFAQKMENFDLLGFTLFKQPNYLLFAQSLHPWKIDATYIIQGGTHCFQFWVKNEGIWQVQKSGEQSRT